MTSSNIHTRSTLAQVLVLAALAMLAAGVTPVQAQSSSSTNTGWRTTIYPIYAWLPVFGAEVRFPDGPPCDGCEPIPERSASSNLNGAAFAGALVENKWVQIDANFLWAGLSAERELPNLKVKANALIGSGHFGVRVAPALFVNAGVRRVALNTKTSAFDFDEVEWEPGAWEGLIGASFTPHLASHLRLVARADYGGFGSDVVTTSSATGSLEWEALPHFVVTAGYGYLGLKADGQIRSRPIHLKQTLHGPIVGIGFTF